MWARVKRWLLGGLRGALLAAVDELDGLEPKMRELIKSKGPDAAVAIVDLVQDWLRGLVARTL